MALLQTISEAATCSNPLLGHLAKLRDFRALGLGFRLWWDGTKYSKDHKGCTSETSRQVFLELVWILGKYSCLTYIPVCACKGTTLKAFFQD